MKCTRSARGAAKRLAFSCLTLAVFVWSGGAHGAETGARKQYTGRPLIDVLKELEARGLRIVYSSELVRPHMRVEREPTSDSPRRLLAQILASHGLRLQVVPGVDALAIVRAARAPSSSESKEGSGLRVIVRSRGPELAVAGLSVRVLPEEALLTTDAGGEVVLRGVSPGIYELQAHLPGFRFRSLDVSIPAGRLGEVVLDAEPDDTPAQARLEPLELLFVEKRTLKETVDVYGALEETAAEPGPAKLPVQRVNQMAGSVENVFRAAQNLPGVTGANDFQSRVSVRGGTPDQNLTILDGLEIYNPFRLEGLVSAFNPDTVEDFSLDPVLPARYGDRLSSVLVVRSREGRRDRSLGGSAAVSLTDANVVLDGRLPAEGSWLLTTRRTYYDFLAEKVFTPNVNYPGFHDVQLKSSVTPFGAARLSFFGLRSRESATDEQFPGAAHVDGYRSRNDAAGLTLTWMATPRLVYTSSMSLYRNNVDFDFGTPSETYDLERHTSVRDVALRQNVRFERGDGLWVEAGAEVHDLDTAWKMDGKGLGIALFRRVGATIWGDGVARPIDSRLFSTKAAGWVEGHLDATARLTLDLGTRVQRGSRGAGVLVLPRARATWSADDSTRLWIGAAWNAQSPGYEKQLQGDYFLDLSDPQAMKSERSRQLFAGFGRDLGGGVSLKVEAYHKRFDDLLVGRLETEEERGQRLAGFDIPADYVGPLNELRPTAFPVNAGTGTAYGFELMLERRASSPDTRLMGWASYTFARSERTAYRRTFPSDYDRPHSASLVGTFRLSPRLHLSGSWRLASGLPYTPIKPDVFFAPDEGDLDHDSNREELRPVRWPDGNFIRTNEALPSLADINSGRLPFYSRLDLRASHFRDWGSRQWEFYLDVINVLNRKNTSFYDLEHVPGSATSAAEQKFFDKPTRALPFIPSFGIRLKF